MKEFYFVMPEEKSIPKFLDPFWRGHNFLVSAKQYFNDKTKQFDLSNYPFNPRNYTGKIIIDSGAFQYILKKNSFPFTPEEYAQFLQKIKPTYGVAMDFPCIAPTYHVNNIKDLELRKILRSNSSRIKASVENAILNIELSKNLTYYQPVSVVQGFTPRDYKKSVKLLHEYNAITPFLAVGSLAKRRKNQDIIKILKVIRSTLNSLGYKNWHLHAFGLSFSKLNNAEIRNLITSSDSASWIYSLKRFHRVIVYNPLRTSLQEIDFGFGAYHDWKKYANITFNAYIKKIYDLTHPNFSPSIEYISNIKRHMPDYKITLEWDNELNINKIVYHNSETNLLLTIMNHNAILVYNPEFHVLILIPAMRNAKFIQNKDIDTLNMISIESVNQDLKTQDSFLLEKLFGLLRLQFWDFLGINSIKCIKKSKEKCELSPKAPFIKKKSMNDLIMPLLEPFTMSISRLFSKNTKKSSKNSQMECFIPLQYVVNILFFNDTNTNQNYSIHQKKHEPFILIQNLKLLDSNDPLQLQSKFITFLELLPKLIELQVHSLKHDLVTSFLNNHNKSNLTFNEFMALGLITGLFLYQHEKRITLNPRLLASTMYGQIITLLELAKLISYHSTQFFQAQYPQIYRQYSKLISGLLKI